MMPRSSPRSNSIIEFLSLLWRIVAFVIMTMFEKLANVADEILWTIDDYKIYKKNIVKVKRFKQDRDQIHLEICLAD